MTERFKSNVKKAFCISYSSVICVNLPSPSKKASILSNKNVNFQKLQSPLITVEFSVNLMIISALNHFMHFFKLTWSSQE